MNKPKFNIGDTAWIPIAQNKDKWVTCDCCYGQRAITITYGNGETASLDCAQCGGHGYYDYAKGGVREYEFTCSAEEITITDICWSSFGYFEYNHRKEVYTTKEEALSAAQAVGEKERVEAEKRFKWGKENAAKTWAWNATYHRKGLKEALRQVEYHTAKLNHAKVKSKSPETNENRL